jgi:hypothetical protein
MDTSRRSQDMRLSQRPTDSDTVDRTFVFLTYSTRHLPTPPTRSQKVAYVSKDIYLIEGLETTPLCNPIRFSLLLLLG